MKNCLLLFLCCALTGLAQAQVIEAPVPHCVNSLAEQSEENQVYAQVEQMPEFPGGQHALYEFLHRQQQYPEAAKKAGMEGNTYVSFVVEKDGSISEPQIVRSIGRDFDVEALRLVRLLKFVPGMQSGKVVRVSYTLPVRFRLH